MTGSMTKEAARLERPASTTLYFGPWYRRSPFFEATLRAGCSAYDIYNHMYLPAYYDDPVTEYWALLNGVTVWDVSVERIVQIKGPDAAAFTNLMTCRDLTRCAVGQGKYAPILAPKGGIVNDPVLLRVAEDTWWLALADSDVGLYARGIAYGVRMDVEISEPPVYPLQVQGPRSKDVIGALFGQEVVDLRYYWCADASVDGIPVVVSRTGWTGEVGYEVYLRDPDRGDDLWERLMAAGAAFDIRPIAPCEARRIEAGIFNYNSDMTIENNPFEVVGMERLVEAQEANYIGKDALERIRRDGVSRKLVGIEVGGDPLPFEIAEPWPAYRDGERVGRVTDLIRSPRLERNVGYVWVPIELAEPGTALEVEMPDRTRAAATTAALPFLDPKKDIPKG
jgi:glycine cleavage system aminomethyltransferase T